MLEVLYDSVQSCIHLYHAPRPSRHMDVINGEVYAQLSILDEFGDNRGVCFLLCLLLLELDAVASVSHTKQPGLQGRGG